MTISVRLSKEETEFFKAYADIHNITVSEMVRKFVTERIEDEYDLKAYEEALEEYKNNPKTYSHSEVCRMLEII